MIKQIARLTKKIKYLKEILFITMKIRSNQGLRERVKLAIDIQNGQIFRDGERIHDLPEGVRILPFNSNPTNNHDNIADI